MICPNCHNDQSVTEHNYGALYTCKTCQAVYFIGFDGQPVFSNEVPSTFEELLDSPIDMSSLPPTNLPEAVSDAIDDLQPKIQQSQMEAAPLVQFNQNEFAVESEPFLKFPPSKTQFSDIAKDISDYGNSETQIAHLNYDLSISGLDTAEIMSGLKEAIEDSRFGWDVNEVMRTIKRGEIYFEKLNPVKAYILAKRLQFLNVEKVWKQNAVG